MKEVNALTGGDAASAVLAARTLLLDATPLKADCGRLCGAACCQADAEAQSGMYLVPGEAALYQPMPVWAHIVPTGWNIHGRPAPLLVCDGTCPRAERPLACRVFPLMAKVDGKNFLIRPDPRGWPICPLTPHGLRGLDPAFIAAVSAAFSLLWAVPAHRDFLRALDSLLGEYELL